MSRLENKSTGELLALAEHDPEAQFQLGLNYADGKGVQQDWEKCAEWFRKAAEQGHAAVSSIWATAASLARAFPVTWSRRQSGTAERRSRI